MTVDICNYLRNRVEQGNQVFYPIYSDEEIGENHDLADTGLFVFR